MRWLFHQFRTFRWLAGVWRRRFTPEGKALSVALALSAFGLAALDSPIYLFFWALASVLIVVGILHSLYRPRLEFRVQTPELCASGESISATVTVANRAKHAARQVVFQGVSREHLSVTSPPSETTYLAPGEQHRFRIDMLPQRRGVFSPPRIVASTSFPWNLVRSFLKSPPSSPTLVVAPRGRPIELASWNADGGNRAGKLEGAAIAGRGAGEEYSGSREYQPGVAVRRWDHAAWARLGKPIVREYGEQAGAAAAIVIDAPRQIRGRDSGATDWLESQFEAALVLAASIDQEMSRSRRRLTWLAIGDRLHRLQTIAASVRRRYVLRTLAEARMSETSDTQVVDETARQTASAGLWLFDIQLAARGEPRWLPPRANVQRILIASSASPATVQAATGEGVSWLTPDQIARGGLCL